MTLVAVMIFALLNGVYPTWSWLELPLLLGDPARASPRHRDAAAALFVRFRDIAPIWDVIQQALFYASPILYVTTMVPEEYQQRLPAEPARGACSTQMRHAIIDPTAPSVCEAIGGAERLLIPLGIVVGAFALGWWVFHREAPAHRREPLSRRARGGCRRRCAAAGTARRS